jgi:hypothetical protein
MARGIRTVMRYGNKPILSFDDLIWYTLKRQGLDIVTGGSFIESITARRLDRIKYAIKNYYVSCKECEDEPWVHECIKCGERDCPDGEPLHYHHDGCPSCGY